MTYDEELVMESMIERMAKFDDKRELDIRYEWVGLCSSGEKCRDRESMGWERE